jgi:hypothetical protein
MIVEKAQRDRDCRNGVGDDLGVLRARKHLALEIVPVDAKPVDRVCLHHGNDFLHIVAGDPRRAWNVDGRRARSGWRGRPARFRAARAQCDRETKNQKARSTAEHGLYKYHNC